MTNRFHPTTLDRQRTMLRTAMGPAIASALADSAVIEVMVNPDGRLWLDRHGEGRVDTGKQLGASEAERIIRLVASHIGQECHAERPVVSAELPETGERFEGLLPPVAPAPCFAIRKPAKVLYRLSDYVDAQIMTPLQAKELAEAVASLPAQMGTPKLSVLSLAVRCRWLVDVCRRSLFAANPGAAGRESLPRIPETLPYPSMPPRS